MRTSNTLKNIGLSTVSMIITDILSFISRTIFIQVLGVQYLGINGLFANVLMILSLGELGVGQAITFNLYKPLATNNTIKINALMSLYKRVYRYIGFGVILFGITLLPFLPNITNSVTEVKYLHIIYIIFLLNSSFSYFWGYKRTLIIADQKAYKLVPFTSAFKIGNILIQITILITTGSYILFLVAHFFIILLENVVINHYIDKQYNFMYKGAAEVEKEDKAVIIKNVKAMLFHKIGDISINGTDNIIISTFVNISTVGLFSNYYLLTSVIKKFLLLIFEGASASFGNLLVKETNTKQEEIFRILNFVSFWLFGLTSITLYFVLSPFIELWIGKEFVISNVALLAIVINFYLVGMGTPLRLIKAAGGVYDQDKYFAIAQSIINLILSVVMVQFYGLTGVMLGTLIATICVPLWNRPYIVYKHIFKHSSKTYFLKLVLYSFSTLAIAFLIQFLLYKSPQIENMYYQFIYRLLVCIVIPNVIFYIFFKNSDEFIRLKPYIQIILKRKKKYENV